MNTKDIHRRLVYEFKTESVIIVNERTSQPILQVPPELLFDICQFLQKDEQLYFDFLSCITGIDNGPEKGTMEVLYHLTSIPYQTSVILKVILPRKDMNLLPSVHSVSPIWQTANWHEREAFDLLGIYFENHPDLRRILLPGDWKGYPLRKDYQEQTSYHGIKVKY
ncbi:NADH-quinone oxidoreductase subunit C [Runella slithyformis]|uniref:NADH-quinone oxidoreductase subunit C n=1 Tax=Runella slithyformis (strain ATCC 29530 / DSM 19594 / LMG 11500 / NCIMB 11436 / LSU 4) TaxID=761193 RepID=A0A7U4E5H3_RUNSL|nr:NADH-quinone oxidoreductase subunit C [Runella slithyformis]AEI48134.1 NAD(P)H-quinone oxidoreductase subunit J [Runella slithyformis DSM 19594]